MGEKKTRFKKFRSEHPFCCYCGGLHPTESIDHAPPKTFFYGKKRPEGLEVPACNRCNQVFAKFDDFFALLSFSQASFHNDKLERRTHQMISGCIRRFPDAIMEIAKNARSDYILHQAGIWKPGAKIRFTHPDLHFTINYAIARLVAAHYYEFKKVPLPVGATIWTHWYSNAQPMAEEDLRRLLDHLPHYATLRQGNWNTEKQYQVRYEFADDIAVGGCAFNFHQSFVGTGFVFPDSEDIHETDEWLFSVTKNGIEPAKLEFPEQVRLPERRQEP